MARHMLSKRALPMQGQRDHPLRERSLLLNFCPLSHCLNSDYRATLLLPPVQRQKKWHLCFLPFFTSSAFWTPEKILLQEETPPSARRRRRIFWFLPCKRESTNQKSAKVIGFASSAISALNDAELSITETKESSMVHMDVDQSFLPIPSAVKASLDL